MMDAAGNGDRTLDRGAALIHAGKTPVAGKIDFGGGKEERKKR